MNKYIVALLFLILCSCKGKKNENETIRVSVLRGPSAIAFTEWMENAPHLDGKTFSVEIIDSPEIMQASLIKGKTDIAVLPMISAANLYNKGVCYPLLGCPIWGTLYLVKKEGNAEKNEISEMLHIFGAGTTPDILTRYYLQQNHLEYLLNYSFPTAREIMQGLLVGKIESAVLSEPYLSMALNKDSSLQIIADLNVHDSSSYGFAQTAILCKPSLLDKQSVLDSLLDVSCRFATEKPKQVIHLLESKGVFPKGMLTAESIERCKIHYVPASDAKENILRFLQLVDQYEPAAIGGKLPDNSFIGN